MSQRKRSPFRLIWCANAVYRAHLPLRKIRFAPAFARVRPRFGSSLNGALQKSLPRFANPCNLRRLRIAPHMEGIAREMRASISTSKGFTWHIQSRLRSAKSCKSVLSSASLIDLNFRTKSRPKYSRPQAASDYTLRTVFAGLSFLNCIPG